MGGRGVALSSAKTRRKVLQRVADGQGAEVEIEFVDEETIRAVSHLIKNGLIEVTTKYDRTGNYLVTDKGAIASRSWLIRSFYGILISSKENVVAIIWASLSAIIVVWVMWAFGPQNFEMRGVPAEQTELEKRAQPRDK